MITCTHQEFILKKGEIEMKKILAAAIIAVMTLVLCIPAFAAEPATSASLDRIYVNNAETPLFDGYNQELANSVNEELTSLRVRGWGFFNDNSDIEEFGYRIDNGTEVIVSGAAFLDEVIIPILNMSSVRRFDFSADVSNVGKGEHTFTIVIKAQDGTVADLIPSFKFVQQKEASSEQPSDPGEPAPTSDAAIIAIAAVGCIALAGVVVAKKVK